MRSTPDFWWQEQAGVAATALRPLGHIYGVVTARRMARPGTVLPVPVLCVGNLVAGGAGKTPTAIAIAHLLRATGHRPAFLSRGYGRPVSRPESRRVLRVEPDRQDADEVGDEPLLLARAAPTYVSSDRLASGRVAIADGSTVLVLDDGLQNPTLSKTMALAVVDGTTGVGNGFCVPAGPLRAPLAAQWPFVTAVCLIGKGRPGRAAVDTAGRYHRPVWPARLVPDADVVAALRATPLYAFAGIGRPEKLFDTLESSGLALRGRRAFPDHHRFTRHDLETLRDAAAALGARLVTTAKDRVRLPADFPALALPVSLVFDDAAAASRDLAVGLGRWDANRHANQAAFAT